MNKTFWVWAPDRGTSREDSVQIAAFTAERAAEKWAEEDDQYGDYDILRGQGLTVHVLEDGVGVVRVFTVSGESTPQYYADEVSHAD